MRILFSFFVIIVSSISLAQEHICGNSTVNIEKVGEWESSRFFITATNGTDDTKLVLNSVDYVSFACEANIRNQNKILVLAICGGSGCSESTYTVIDARTLKLELVPFQGQGNLGLVENLLGRRLER